MMMASEFDYVLPRLDEGDEDDKHIAKYIRQQQAKIERLTAHVRAWEEADAKFIAWMKDAEHPDVGELFRIGGRACCMAIEVHDKMAAFQPEGDDAR